MPSDNRPTVKTFEQAIAALGGTKAAAERFGYFPSRVCYWREKLGAIPADLFLLANIELAKEGYRATWSVFNFRREKHERYKRKKRRNGRR